MSALQAPPRVMGSDLDLVVFGPERLMDLAVRRLQDLEARWSRFLPDSEVSRLNRAGGVAVTVSWETRLLVAAGCEAWRQTSGAFDPTVLAAVRAAGYRERVPAPGSIVEEGVSSPAPGCDGIEVDEQAGTVTIPPGVGFDPGGIGKGLAADLVVGEVLAAGAGGAAVNVGGDVRVSGEAPDGDWMIDVEDPFRPERALASLRIADGAVATSSTLIRRWATDSGDRHHLVDPATGGRPPGDLVSVSAVAGAGWLAEAHAKAAILASGGSEAVARLDRAGLTGIAVDSRGRRWFGAGVGAFL